jgi:hypothetical protein
MNTLSLKDLARELDDLRERAELDEDEKDTLAELIAVEDTLGDLYVYSRNVSDVLIDDDDFYEFIQQEMEEVYLDISDLPEVIKCNIDWAGVGNDAKNDYNEVEYKGNTYQIIAG